MVNWFSVYLSIYLSMFIYVSINVRSIGAAVKLAETKGVPLNELTLTDLQSLHPSFTADVSALWSYEHSAESRDSVGGTSKRRVLEQIEAVRSRYLSYYPI